MPGGAVAADVASIQMTLISNIQSLFRSFAARLRCVEALAMARRSSTEVLARSVTRRVLIVCYGNIYRSAFVEVYLTRRSIPGLQVRSAGLHPEAHRRVPPRHVQMSQSFGVDLSAHRSAVLTADDLAWADLIILMDRHNWQALIERGAVRERLVWLGALDGGTIEIPDPYQLDDAHAQRIVSRLAACSKHLADTLER